MKKKNNENNLPTISVYHYFKNVLYKYRNEFYLFISFTDLLPKFLENCS